MAQGAIRELRRLASLRSEVISKAEMALEKGLTTVVPKKFYEKPFVRRMLDPSTLL